MEHEVFVFREEGQMKAGEKYVFTKSGSVVQLIAQAEPIRKEKAWSVRRVDTGKEMFVMESSLESIPEEERCVNCGIELNEAIDSDPNGAKNCICARCRAEEAHDYDKEPNAAYDRHGRRVSCFKCKLCGRTGFDKPTAHGCGGTEKDWKEYKVKS